ncbi:unnamed protein product [Caenorhabditis nigoni]
MLSSDRQVWRAMVSGVDEPVLNVECNPEVLILPSFDSFRGVLRSLDETTTRRGTKNRYARKRWSRKNKYCPFTE